MGLRSNKKGSASLRKTIRGLPRGDQDKGIDLLEDAEAVFAVVGAPSRLGTAVLLAIIRVGTGVEEGNPIYGQVVVFAQMGYCCRMSQDAEVPTEMSEKIEAALIRGEHGEVDIDGMADGDGYLSSLIKQVAAFADQPLVIGYLAGCSQDAWKAFSATATFQLHSNLVKNGTKKSMLLTENGIDGLLRLGYMVRVVDEVAGLEPTLRM